MIRSDDALRAQQLASRPDYSTWVEANAGSGKTTAVLQCVVLPELSPFGIVVWAAPAALVTTGQTQER